MCVPLCLCQYGHKRAKGQKFMCTLVQVLCVFLIIILIMMCLYMNFPMGTVNAGLYCIVFDCIPWYLC